MWGPRKPLPPPLRRKKLRRSRREDPIDDLIGLSPNVSPLRPIPDHLRIIQPGPERDRQHATPGCRCGRACSAPRSGRTICRACIWVGVGFARRHAPSPRQPLAQGEASLGQQLMRTYATTSVR